MVLGYSERYVYCFFVFFAYMLYFVESDIIIKGGKLYGYVIAKI